MSYAREIKASTKVTGKRRLASIEAARRKVKDGELYFIRRHDAYFRPGAHGYVTDIAGAGLFSAECARRYLDCEGLSVVSLTSRSWTLEEELGDALKRVELLRALIAQMGRRR